jgi:hypothetical protein
VAEDRKRKILNTPLGKQAGAEWSRRQAEHEERAQIAFNQKMERMDATGAALNQAASAFSQGLRASGGAAPVSGSEPQMDPYERRRRGALYGNPSVSVPTGTGENSHVGNGAFPGNARTQ